MKKWLFWAVGCVLTPSVASMEAYTSLSSSVEMALEDEGRVQKARFMLQPKLELESDSSKAYINARLWSEQANELFPTGLNRQSYSSSSSPVPLGDSAYLELPEIWWEGSTEQGFDWRLGKQILNWGSLDELRVLDLINPQHFREFVFEDLSETRLGLWGASVQRRTTLGRFEFFVSDDHTTHELAPADGAFALRAPRFRLGFEEDSLAALPIAPRMVTLRPTQSTAALRLTGRSSVVDYNLVAYTGPDHTSVGKLSFNSISGVGPTATVIPQIETLHEKRQVLGFGLAKALWGAIVRMEYGWGVDRAFNGLSLRGSQPVLEVLKRDQHQLAIGLDMNLPAALFMNVQWLIDRVEGNPTTLIRPGSENLLTLFLRKSWANDRIETKLRWVSTQSGEDGLVKLLLDYAWNDETRVSAGSDLAYGSENQLFGQFSERSRAYVRLTHEWSD